MSNPFFEINAGATTPTLDVALLDSNRQIVDLGASTVVFNFYNLGGGTPIFSRAGSVVTPSQGYVRYSWQAGDTATAGRYLGKFVVTYPNATTQAFPENRYIRITVV